MFDDRIISVDDGNIESIRKRYPDGLHFVVGDTHGEAATLELLMNKIKFDATKDHVYFVGDYNEFRADRKAYELLQYMAQYYQEDYMKPGFHLIRGNHERDYKPKFPLDNIPDIIVIRGKVLNYFLAHAGMVKDALDLICTDIENTPDGTVFAYSLSVEATAKDGPFRQVVNSRKGLYSQVSDSQLWPDLKSLHAAKACIIHGHTPYFKLQKNNVFSYGGETLFWEKQKIFFAEDLQSFNIDSGIKKHYGPEAAYERGLSCICLEIPEELAEKNGGILKCEDIRQAENFVFGQAYYDGKFTASKGDIEVILRARPKTKNILITGEVKNV